MTVLEFMNDSPIVTIIVVYLICSLVLKVYNRTIRHLDIRKHGWPPPHCDADGDFREYTKDQPDANP